MVGPGVFETGDRCKKIPLNKWVEDDNKCDTLVGECDGTPYPTGFHGFENQEDVVRCKLRKIVARGRGPRERSVIVGREIFIEPIEEPKKVSRHVIQNGD